MKLNTKEELYDAIENAVHSTEEVGDEYGNNITIIVFERDGKFWQAEYDYNRNDGIHWYGPIECHRVERREVIKKVWVRV